MPHAISRFEGHRGRVCAVRLAPDGRRAVSGGADGLVKVRFLLQVVGYLRNSLFRQEIRQLSDQRSATTAGTHLIGPLGRHRERSRSALAHHTYAKINTTSSSPLAFLSLRRDATTGGGCG